MIKRPFDSITKVDLERLVEFEIGERRDLEFKELLPGNLPEARREFCYDVAAMANSGGGDLIYGVRERRSGDKKPTGIPEAIVGLADDNLGAAELRLQQILQSGIDPRIVGVGVRQIPGFELGPALIVRVPRSWAAPHAVPVNDSFRFYARHGQGKFLLDVDGIREAFLRSTTFGERATAFRRSRVGSLARGEHSLPLTGRSLIVLHTMAAAPGPNFITTTADEHDFIRLSLSGGGGPLRYNFDGVAFPCPTASGKYQGYVQAFRDGALESVDAGMLSNDRRSIPSTAFEERLVNAVAQHLLYLQRFSAEPPFAIMLSLLGVQWFQMGVSQEVARFEPTKIDREQLLLPEVVVESADVDVPRELRPIFDVAWQSAGFPRSLNYNSQGEWKP